MSNLDNNNTALKIENWILGGDTGKPQWVLVEIDGERIAYNNPDAQKFLAYLLMSGYEISATPKAKGGKS